MSAIINFVLSVLCVSVFDSVDFVLLKKEHGVEVKLSVAVGVVDDGDDNDMLHETLRPAAAAAAGRVAVTHKRR